ncbi:hypothetical protein AB0L26_00275 [Streptomyces nondiastaticus]|uniref:hypothetical protein n=1 Tax=Streptomyces nondiastaticus TaxID=3154512 RepID=UPI00341C7DFC
MTVFVCAGCDAVLTAPVSEVALPVHAHHTYGHDMLPALMEQGTYAVDPEPSGPPRRLWDEISPDEAEARGVFAPVFSLSFGAPGAVVIAPGDARGTVLIPERCEGYCMGITGADGPNLACAKCGRLVATRVDDCSLWQAVWFAPDAVRRVPGDEPGDGPDDGPGRRTAGWEELSQGRPGTPPVDPCGGWNPRWEAAAGAALAHLLVASEGRPVALPDGLVTDMFGHVLDALLPPGPPVRTAALAGPGLPGPGPAAGIVLVPRHPRTGEAWQPAGGADVVPLAAEVWAHLAFHNERLLVPATGGLPDGVLRDDPPPMRPWSRFRPDPHVLLRTLARLPAVRRPWLRAIYDRVNARPYDRPF